MKKSIQLPRSVSIDFAIGEFLLDGRARQFTIRTIDHYRARLGTFARWAAQQEPSTVNVNDVTPTCLRSYLVYRQERGLASNTRHTEARALRAFLNFCTREGWLEESPFAKVKMPKADAVQKTALTPAEVKKLIAACETVRARALLLTMLDTGMRAQEVCNLNVGDYDRDRLVLVIRLGKGRKDRNAFITARTARQLGRYLGERNNPNIDEPLFASESQRNYEGRLSRSGLRRILKVIGEDAGVKNCAPHEIRRTFATMALRNGMSMHVLAALLGHADLTMLKRYVAMLQDDLQRDHDKFSPVANLK